MRATCFGARSGRISITTLPFVVSSVRVSSGLAIFCTRLLLDARIKSAHDAAASLHVGGDLHFHHLVGVGHGAALRTGWRLLELVGHLHAGNDLADHGVLIVEKRCVAE